MPADMTADWAVESVDRMGEWYTYLLLYPSTGDRDVLARFAAAWDGDQLLALRRKDGTSSGIVWTTVWDDAAAATLFAAELKHLHDTLNDGEPTLIERRDNEVCFVKNMPQSSPRSSPARRCTARTSDASTSCAARSRRRAFFTEADDHAGSLPQGVLERRWNQTESVRGGY